MTSLSSLLIKARAVARLKPIQIYGHVRRRVRNRVVPRFADRYRASLEAQAAALPPFQPDPRAQALARLITSYYEVEYDNTVPDCFEGRFTLMGLTVDFGSSAAIDWRVAAEEGNRPLWRSNLSQLGYLPVAVLRFPERGFAFAAELVRSFRATARFERSNDFVEMWHPYIASRRVQSLASVLLLAPAGARGTRDWADIEDFLRLNVVYVMRNLEIDLGFNHLERNLAALALFALCCETVPAAIAQVLRANIDAIIDRSICNDGVPEERSTMYLVLTIQSFRTFAALDIWSPRQRELIDSRLPLLETTLAALTLGDGYPVLFNDCWLGEFPPTREVVGERHVGFHAMPDGGYVRMAAGDLVLVMDAGPIGPDENPGHGHADFLSMEVSAGARRLLVDPGAYLYTAGPVRDELRGWAAHNGPAFLEGRPVEFIDSFKVGRHAAARLDEAKVDADGVQRARGTLAFDGYEVSRRVELVDGRLTIADDWSGAGTPQTRFLVPSEWTLAQAGSSIVLSAGRTIVTLTWGEDTRVVVGQATWSHHYRSKEPAHEIVFSPRPGSSTARYVFDVSHPPTT